MNPFSTVAAFIRDGGPFMYVILATAVVIVAIAVERLIVIGAAAAFNSRKLTDDLVRSVSQGDILGARNLCVRSKAPAAKVANAMLQAGSADELSLQSAADDAATLVLPHLSRRLAHLNMLANVATLLGLLGTIFGLITAFSAVGAADPSQRAAFLAAGISEALNTTALGLIVAVPTLLVHGYLAGIVESVAEQVDEVGIRLTRAIAQAASGRGAARPVALHGGSASPRGAQ
jgi:biopolymer transport protein ExbB/TolQ